VSHRDERGDTEDPLRALGEIASEGVAVRCRRPHGRLLRQFVADTAGDQLDGDDAEGQIIRQAEGEKSVCDLAVGEVRLPDAVALHLALVFVGGQLRVELAVFEEQ